MTDTPVRPSFTPPVQPKDSSADEPCSVATLGQTIRGYIDRLGAPWVEGEITQWNVRRGSVFATLRDLHADAAIQLWVKADRAGVPRNLAPGDHVLVQVKPTYWPRSGDLKYDVWQLRKLGLGDLLEKLERLRQTLRAEGLFDPARKRPLPFLPHRIGLVTGRGSDAEKDVVHNARLRWPEVDLRVEYAAVQGDRCVPEVLRALDALEADDTIDVVVIARGGGDFEALLPFSDERVVRRVAAMSTPVVSAIGHENDRPLLDDVADLRASTPTDAAKRIVPDVREELEAVAQWERRLTLRLRQRLEHEHATISHLRTRPVLARPGVLVDEREREVSLALTRGRELLGRSLERESGGLTAARATLRAVSPESTLDRGYAIVQRRGDGILFDAADAPEGTDLVVLLARGSLAATSRGELSDEAD